MRWIALTVMACLTASCGIEGEFCTLAEPLRAETHAVGEFIVDNDTALAKGLSRHNKLVGRCP